MPCEGPRHEAPPRCIHHPLGDEWAGGGVLDADCQPIREGVLAENYHMESICPGRATSPATCTYLNGTFVDERIGGALGQYTLDPIRVRDLGPRPTILLTVTPPPERRSLPSQDDLRERFGLTPRQAEVTLLLAERYSNKEIAAALGVSVHTARHHVNAVLNQFGVSRNDVGRVVTAQEASS